MLRCFYQQLRPTLLFKPDIYIHRQEHTTEAEERAIIDAAIQLGARRAVLYPEPLPELLARARSEPKMKRACVLHIEPRD